MKKIICILAILLTCGCQDIASTKSQEKENQTQVNYFEQDEGYNYHYQHLEKKDQNLYQDIYNCLVQQGESAKINSGDVNHVSQICEDILEDHPEIFYLEDWTVYEKDNNCKIEPYYTFTKKEIEEYNETLEDMKASIVEETKNMETYDQIQYVYDYVITYCYYDENAEYNQEIISSMINHNTVCSGYAKMVQYLLEELDINCTYLSGTTVPVDGQESESHAWNMVCYEDDYYYIDATWGDCEEKFDEIFYDYFMFDSTDMLKLYQPYNLYEETTNHQNCYFVKTQTYFDSYDKDKMKQAISSQDQQSISFKFSDDCYSYAKEKLVESGDAYDIIDSDSIQYIEDEYLNTIYLKWS